MCVHVCPHNWTGKVAQQPQDETDEGGIEGEEEKERERERDVQKIYLKYSNTVGTGNLSSGKSSLQREINNTHSTCFTIPAYIQQLHQTQLKFVNESLPLSWDVGGD